MDRSNLAEGLTSLKIVKDLITVVNLDKGIQTLDIIVQKLSNLNADYRKIPQWDEQYRFSPKENIILSLFALISEAKVVDSQNGRKSPFLYTQVQLWIRELSGVLRVVSQSPRFAWKAEGVKENSALPPWFCRDCGASGWLGIKHDNKERFEKDIADVYAKFFSNHKHIYFANRTSWFTQKDALEGGYEPTDTFQKFIGNSTFELYTEAEEDRTSITAFRRLDKNGRNEHICPECNTKNTLAIIGTRIATLSSISVSQILATDLDKQDEKNRKVLAFTNSVQDAAHQAGFVEARNYRFTFRASLQKVINNLNQPVSLSKLASEFTTYWKEHSDETGKQPLEAYYYRFYPSDYIGKSAPGDYQNSKGEFEEHFKTEFDNRMLWELFSEFGYNAQIGRTLEKTGSSATHFAKEDLLGVWGNMLPWLERNESTQSLDQNAFLLFVDLLLHRVRIRGAVSHPFLDKFRQQDLKLWDLNWMKDPRHYLNRKFSPRSRIPKLLTYLPESRGILDSTFAKTSNWFHSFFKKSFPLASNHQDYINEFYEELLKSLLTGELIDESNSEEKINFALNPAKLLVSNHVRMYECAKCGHRVAAGTLGQNLVGGRCLVFRCQGDYQENQHFEKDNYYQLVYNRKRSPRIYAADHTGLLERKDRELLELDFKTRPNFNSKNTMVATSTLEMGIDIGDLNSAINNSIPPLPSNFMQRVGRAGRAGRSSGSALIVNFAKSQAHDLFYNTEPIDMMAGDVNTPGCYLEAKEILKRHFFAFCIDSWTKDDPRNHHIPFMIRTFKIETTDLLGTDFFLNKILHYIKINEEKLFEKFRAGYGNEVKEDVFKHLKYELGNEAFYQFHRKIFVQLKDEILKIQLIRQEIEQRIIDLKLGKDDPERVELEKEKKNLHGIIQSIKKKNTLEHLTNVGALPNYAFPETGVELTAKVLGNKAEGSTKSPLNKDFGIVRSASQAIKEFAPDNYFYSQGYKFLITGVNTFDWSDRSNFHKKRFCSNCDHIELEAKVEKGNCPKCGDESWSASSNVHTYAKLLSVRSFNNQSDASITDSNEDRENLRYKLTQHFHFPEKNSRGSYVMKEIPFGIEFYTEVKILEANLGRADVVDPRKVEIHGVEVPAHGFITCRHCGKSSSNVRQKVNGKDYKFHYGYCKHKAIAYNGQSDTVFEEIFFYREIQTEALKVLLPVQELDSSAEVKMFQAGIELGLKKYFNGNPQHIRLVFYSEYNNVTTKFDNYLVLYDSIPGGTGYLEKLFSANEFSMLLTKAYHEIKNCSCQHFGMDGCYRCIYSYSNQYHQSELSRAQAEKRFFEIIKRNEDWEKQNGSLSNLTNAGNIEESELEERFVRSLKKLAKSNQNWEMEDVNDDGTLSYTLAYSDACKKLNFHVRPQVNLGKTDGIEFHTRSDFLIICTHCEVNGVEIEDKASIPRIVVYLDGFQYHASEEHNSFLNDLEKRKAISKSQSHYSWTLTWDDVELFDACLGGDAGNESKDFLQKRLEEKDFQNTRTTLTKAVKRNLDFLKSYGNNFRRLLEHLKSIDNLTMINNNTVLYLSFFHKKLFTPSYAPEKIDEALQAKSMDTFCLSNKTLDGLIPVSGCESNPLFDMQLAVNIQKNKVFYRYSFGDTNEINKEYWNNFWIIFNLLQFFEQNGKDEVELDSDIEIVIDEILEGFHPKLRKVIQKLYHSGILKTEQDEMLLNSLLDEKGNVIAEAELILQADKKVYKPCSQDDLKIFTEQGFTCIADDELKEMEL